MDANIKRKQETVARAFNRWLPKPVVSPAVPSETVTATRVTAAPLNIVKPDECPYCKLQMRPTTALGIDCYVCDNDRYVAPAENKTTLTE